MVSAERQPLSAAAERQPIPGPAEQQPLSFRQALMMQHLITGLVSCSTPSFEACLESLLLQTELMAGTGLDKHCQHWPSVSISGKLLGSHSAKRRLTLSMRVQEMHHQHLRLAGRRSRESR